MEIPICPNCKIKLNNNGGTTNGSMLFWICWECNYQIEDILTDVEIKPKQIK